MFNQTGGIVGSASYPVGLMVGGNISNNLSSAAFTTPNVGTYNLGANSVITAGMERVGVNGTGTFNQSGGTNAILGGGGFSGAPSGVNDYINSYGVLMLGYYGSKMGAIAGGQSTGYYGNGVGTYNLSGGLLTGARAVMPRAARRSSALPARESSPRPVAPMLPPWAFMSAACNTAASTACRPLPVLESTPFAAGY